MRSESDAAVAARSGDAVAEQRLGAELRFEYASDLRRLSYVEPMLEDDSERANGVRGLDTRAAAMFLSSFSLCFSSMAAIDFSHAVDRLVGSVVPPKALPAMGPSRADMILTTSSSCPFPFPSPSY